MITLNITPEQLEAIKIAFAEIYNSAEWAEYCSEEQIEHVYATADYFTKLNPSWVWESQTNSELIHCPWAQADQ